MTGQHTLLAISLCLALPAAAVSAQTGADTAIAAPRCDYGEVAPDHAQALSGFAFLIGDYSVSAHAWTGEDWSPPRPGAPARWNGWYGLGGTAIIDEWFDRDPGMEPETGRGINVRLFDEETAKWQMMWIHSNAKQVSNLEAEQVDGVLTMVQVHPAGRNFKAEFEVLDDDNWQRIAYERDEAGEWQRRFLLRATRIPCPASAD